MLATPLLDRQEPVQVNPPRKTRDLLIGLPIGAALGLVLGAAEVGREVLLWLFPALWLAILVHEAGHLVAGLLVGFHIRQFAAGPIVIAREAGGVRFHFVPARMFSGQVQAVPPSTGGLRRKFLLFAAGGPVATALLFVALALLPAGPLPAALAIVNVLLAAMSWIPSYYGGMASDGKCIQLLRRPSPEGDLLVALLYLIALDTQGVAPDEWDPAMADRLHAPGATPLNGSAAVLRITRALLADDREELTAAVERGLSLALRMAPDLRRICFDAAAWAQAFCRGNANLAELWMADARSVKGAVSWPDWNASSQAAIAIARGDYDDARQWFSRAIAGLDRRPGTSGSVRACRARFAALLDSLPRNIEPKAS